MRDVMGIISDLLDIGAFVLFGIAILVFACSIVINLGKKKQDKSLRKIALWIVLIAVACKIVSFLLPSI
jgi:hypothetical protein